MKEIYVKFVYAALVALCCMSVATMTWEQINSYLAAIPQR